MPSTESSPSPVHRKPEIPPKISHHYQHTAATHVTHAADPATAHLHGAPTSHIYHPLNPPFQGFLFCLHWPSFLLQPV